MEQLKSKVSNIISEGGDNGVGVVESIIYGLKYGLVDNKYTDQQKELLKQLLSEGVDQLNSSTEDLIENYQLEEYLEGEG